MPRKYIAACNIDTLRCDSPEVRNCSYLEVTRCPMCHCSLSPLPLSAYYTEGKDDPNQQSALHLLCFCPNCRTTFLCIYRDFNALYNVELSFESPCSISPAAPAGNSYSDAIKNLSPGFVETYSQAAFAESQQLFQICGPGYRKALEILVKDYLSHIHPNDTEKIQSELLGASINRIENNRIKTLAQRSAWIGNDETHYARKHEDLGLSEMKRFIKAMLTYVESELAFEEAESISRK